MTDATTLEQPPALLLDARRAAKALSISPRTLWGLTNAGEIPTVSIGRRKLYDPRDLSAWIDRQKAKG